MASDHVRGEAYQHNGLFFWCKGCAILKHFWWWQGHEEAVANIIANGLPDDFERTLAAVAVMMEAGPWDGATDVFLAAFAAYRAWQKEESNV